MSTSAVTLDGFALIGTTSRGGHLRVTGFDGWRRRTVRRNRQEKAQAAGAWPSHGNSSSRPLTITGRGVYPDAASAAADARQILVLGGDDLSTLSVTDAMGTLTAQVEVDDIQVPPVFDRQFTFVIVLNAPDPILYGPPIVPPTATLSTSGAGVGLTYPLTYPRSYGVAAGVVPGSLALPNDGTVPYWPTLRVDGPVTNPQITLNETGAFIRFNGTVAAGNYLAIDCQNRSVKLNGVVSVRDLITSSGDWLAVPTTGGSVSWTADTADPAALLTAYGFEGAWD